MTNFLVGKENTRYSNGKTTSLLKALKIKKVDRKKGESAAVFIEIRL